MQIAKSFHSIAEKGQPLASPAQ